MDFKNPIKRATTKPCGFFIGQPADSGEMDCKRPGCGMRWRDHYGELPPWYKQIKKRDAKEVKELKESKRRGG